MKEIRAERSAYRKQVSIWILDIRPGHRPAVGTTIEMRVSEDAGYDPEPTIRIEDEEAQQWIDELWRAGFRPSEGTGSAGSLAATERHLADMRRIAFDLMPRTPTRIEIGSTPAPAGPRLVGDDER